MLLNNAKSAELSGAWERLRQRTGESIRGSGQPKKGDRHLLPERLFGCFAQKVRVTFFSGEADGLLSRSSPPQTYGVPTLSTALTPQNRPFLGHFVVISSLPW